MRYFVYILVGFALFIAFSLELNSYAFENYWMGLKMLDHTLFDVEFIHVLWDSICCILIKIKAAIKRQAYFLQREWKTANLLMHVNSHVKYKPCIFYMHLQKEKYCYRNSFFILIKITRFK